MTLAHPSHRPNALREIKATVITSAAHDDGLKNAAQFDVLRELDELLIGELCPRVAWILVKEVGGHEKRSALVNEFIERG